jgi:hypothetical protein
MLRLVPRVVLLAGLVLTVSAPLAQASPDVQYYSTSYQCSSGYYYASDGRCWPNQSQQAQAQRFFNQQYLPYYYQTTRPSRGSWGTTCDFDATRYYLGTAACGLGAAASVPTGPVGWGAAASGCALFYYDYWQSSVRCR